MHSLFATLSQAHMYSAICFAVSAVHIAVHDPVGLAKSARVNMFLCAGRKGLSPCVFARIDGCP